jgi:hypothetical protein
MFVSFEIKGSCLLALARGWSAEVSRIAGTIFTRPDAAYFQMDSVKSVSSRNVSLSVQHYSANHGKNAANRASAKRMMTMQAGAQRRMYDFAASKSALIAWSR